MKYGSVFIMLYTQRFVEVRRISLQIGICRRIYHNFIDSPLVGCGDFDAPLPRQRHDMNNLQAMHPTFASYNNRIFYTSRVSAFSFYLKKKTPAKEKQTQGCAPRPRERHAAVLSLRLSVSWLIEHCGAAIGSPIIKAAGLLAFILQMFVLKSPDSHYCRG